MPELYRRSVARLRESLLGDRHHPDRAWLRGAPLDAGALGRALNNRLAQKVMGWHTAVAVSDQPQGWLDDSGRLVEWDWRGRKVPLCTSPWGTGIQDHERDDWLVFNPVFRPDRDFHFIPSLVERCAERNVPVLIDRSGQLRAWIGKRSLRLPDGRVDVSVGSSHAACWLIERAWDGADSAGVLGISQSPSLQ